jgi:hypothetical protein
MKTQTGLTHTISINDDNTNCSIKIRLDDECKNGHQDFAITATFWEVDKARTDRNMLSGGCCHEDILNVRPDLKPFIDLHLSDWEGVPMYAVENGYYHLTEGFNDKKTPLKDKFCNYYRVTPEQFDIIATAVSSTDFGMKVAGQGILQQWKKQADEAIELLEELTGEKFTPASTRSNWNLPIEKVKEEQRKQSEGYYTPEAIEQRKQDAINKKLAEMEADYLKQIAKMSIEHSINVELFKLGGDKYKDGTIFYSHDNTIKFNWRTFGEQLTPQEIEHIKTNLQVPEGVEYVN